MNGQEMSCCGTLCSQCEYYPEACAGCTSIQGKVFWLEYTWGDICPIYECCAQQRQLMHCGHCNKLPCKLYHLEDPNKSPEQNRLDLACQLTNLRGTMEHPVEIEGEELALEQARLSHKQRAEEMKQEFFAAGEEIINGSGQYDQMDFEPWLKHTYQNYQPETVPSGWCRTTAFFAVRKADGKILGMIDVRHGLSTDFLREYGGNIGYAVRPTQRKKGYAIQMLQLALQYCHTLGLSVVRLGCYTDNIASIHTIERCGGRCVEQKPYLDGKPMYIYEVHLSSSIDISKRQIHSI